MFTCKMSAYTVWVFQGHQYQHNTKTIKLNMKVYSLIHPTVWGANLLKRITIKSLACISKLSSHSRWGCLLARSAGTPAGHGAQTRIGLASGRGAFAAASAHAGTSECQHPVKEGEETWNDVLMQFVSDNMFGSTASPKCPYRTLSDE